MGFSCTKFCQGDNRENDKDKCEVSLQINEGNKETINDYLEEHDWESELNDEKKMKLL